MAPPDLLDTLRAFSTGPLTVERRAEGTREKGRHVPAEPTLITIPEAVVYPASGQEVQRLPEGMRTTETLTVITAVELYGDTETHDPDVLQIAGQRYEVQNVKPWMLGGYWETLATKVAP